MTTGEYNEVTYIIKSDYKLIKYNILLIIIRIRIIGLLLTTDSRIKRINIVL